jgi:hypothetical protein
MKKTSSQPTTDFFEQLDESTLFELETFLKLLDVFESEALRRADINNVEPASASELLALIQFMDSIIYARLRWKEALVQLRGPGNVNEGNGPLMH